MREFASGQIKKGVRSIGFGGDGATWGNYGLVYRDADSALVDVGVTDYTNGNLFTFTAVGATTPPIWHGLAIYLSLFGTTSNSVLATLTFDMSWRPTAVVAPPQAQTPARPN